MRVEDNVDVCITCISPRAPDLPLREELPSLGVELVYNAKGAGMRAVRRESRRAMRRLSAKVERDLWRSSMPHSQRDKIREQLKRLEEEKGSDNDEKEDVGNNGNGFGLVGKEEDEDVSLEAERIEAERIELKLPALVKLKMMAAKKLSKAVSYESYKKATEKETSSTSSDDDDNATHATASSDVSSAAASTASSSSSIASSSSSSSKSSPQRPTSSSDRKRGDDGGVKVGMGLVAGGGSDDAAGPAGVASRDGEEKEEDPENDADADDEGEGKGEGEGEGESESDEENGSGDVIVASSPSRDRSSTPRAPLSARNMRDLPALASPMSAMSAPVRYFFATKRLIADGNMGNGGRSGAEEGGDGKEGGGADDAAKRGRNNGDGGERFGDGKDDSDSSGSGGAEDSVEKEGGSVIAGGARAGAGYGLHPAAHASSPWSEYAWTDVVISAAAARHVDGGGGDDDGRVGGGSSPFSFFNVDAAHRKGNRRRKDGRRGDVDTNFFPSTPTRSSTSPGRAMGGGGWWYDSFKTENEDVSDCDSLLLQQQASGIVTCPSEVTASSGCSNTVNSNYLFVMKGREDMAHRRRYPPLPPPPADDDEAAAATGTQRVDASVSSESSTHLMLRSRFNGKDRVAAGGFDDDYTIKACAAEILDEWNTAFRNMCAMSLMLGGAGRSSSRKSIKHNFSDDEDMRRLRKRQERKQSRGGGGAKGGGILFAAATTAVPALFSVNSLSPFKLLTSSSTSTLQSDANDGVVLPSFENDLFAILSQPYAVAEDVKAVMDTQPNLIRTEVHATGRNPLHAACDRAFPVRCVRSSSPTFPSSVGVERENVALSMVNAVSSFDSSTSGHRHPRHHNHHHRRGHHHHDDDVEENIDGYIDALSADIVNARVLLKLVAWSYVDACCMPDRSGDLPVHLLARRLAEWEREWRRALSESASSDVTMKARGRGGRTSAADAAAAADDDARITTLRRTMAQCIEVVLKPMSDQRALCRARGSVGHALPLHIGAAFGVSYDTIRSLLEEYPEGARVRCTTECMVGGWWCGRGERSPFSPSKKEEEGKGGGGLLALELLERNFKAVGDDEESSGESSRGAGSGSGGDENNSKLSPSRDSDHVGGVKWTNSVLDSGHIAGDDFLRKSDLLFAFHPNILPHRKDPERLKRIESMIRTEAKMCDDDNNRPHDDGGANRYSCTKALVSSSYSLDECSGLSPATKSVWTFLCTHSDPSDPSDNYLDTVKDIVKGLDSIAMEKLISIRIAPDGNELLEVVKSECATILMDSLDNALKKERQEKDDAVVSADSEPREHGEGEPSSCLSLALALSPASISRRSPENTFFDMPSPSVLAAVGSTKVSDQPVAGVASSAAAANTGEGSALRPSSPQRSILKNSSRVATRAAQREQLGRLCRAVFRVYESATPVAFVVLPYKLKAAEAEGGHPTLERPEDAGLAVKFADMLLKMTDAQAILCTLEEKFKRATGGVDRRSFMDLIDGDKHETIEKITEDFLSLFRFTGYLYLLDESNGMPCVPPPPSSPIIASSPSSTSSVSTSASRSQQPYPIIVTNAAKNVRTLLPLMQMGMTLMRGDRAVKVLAESICKGPKWLCSQSWVRAAQEMVACTYSREATGNCSPKGRTKGNLPLDRPLRDQLFEYASVMSSIIEPSRDNHNDATNQLQGTGWAVEVSLVKILLEKFDPKRTRAGLVPIHNSKVTIWAHSSGREEETSVVHENAKARVEKDHDLILHKCVDLDGAVDQQEASEISASDSSVSSMKTPSSETLNHQEEEQEVPEVVHTLSPVEEASEDGKLDDSSSMLDYTAEERTTSGNDSTLGDSLEYSASRHSRNKPFGSNNENLVLLDHSSVEDILIEGNDAFGTSQCLSIDLETRYTDDIAAELRELQFRIMNSMEHDQKRLEYVSNSLGNDEGSDNGTSLKPSGLTFWDEILDEERSRGFEEGGKILVPAEQLVELLEEARRKEELIREKDQQIERLMEAIDSYNREESEIMKEKDRIIRFLTRELEKHEEDEICGKAEAGDNENKAQTTGDKPCKQSDWKESEDGMDLMLALSSSTDNMKMNEDVRVGLMMKLYSLEQKLLEKEMELEEVKLTLHARELEMLRAKDEEIKQLRQKLMEQEYKQISTASISTCGTFVTAKTSAPPLLGKEGIVNLPRD